MTEQAPKPSWVWISSAQSVKDRTVSVLAVVETLGASAFGLWVWLQWGLYPLLLSSLCIAFLTMLRSDASVKLGAAWFEAYMENREEIPLGSWRGLAIIGLSVLISASVAYWLAAHWLPPYSGWSQFWRAGVLGLLFWYMGIAIAFAVAGAGAGAVADAVAGAVAGAIAAAGAAAIAGTAAGAALVILMGPGLAAGCFVRAVFIRAFATLRHFPAGVLQFPTNWTTLVTSVDARTEPELVPGLPEDHQMRVREWYDRVGSDELDQSILAMIALLILFLPPWLFRLTLKSTFLIYWPLLFIGSAPAARKTPQGDLTWDDTAGRSVKDWVAVLLATGALAGIAHSIYDPSFFAQFVAWADPRGLPHHVLLQAFSFKVWELDLWEWFALIASAITLVLFVWANSLNLRQSRRGRDPSWAVLKGYSALNRVKTLCVLATVLTSVFAMVWFVHDSCTLPDAITQILTRLLGAPNGCTPLLAGST